MVADAMMPSSHARRLRLRLPLSLRHATAARCRHAAAITPRVSSMLFLRLFSTSIATMLPASLSAAYLPLHAATTYLPCVGTRRHYFVAAAAADAARRLRCYAMPCYYGALSLLPCFFAAFSSSIAPIRSLPLIIGVSSDARRDDTICAAERTYATLTLSISRRLISIFACCRFAAAMMFRRLRGALDTPICAMSYDARFAAWLLLPGAFASYAMLPLTDVDFIRLPPARHAIVAYTHSYCCHA